MELEKYIVQVIDNFNNPFYILDFGLTKRKTWNKLIKEFGFTICKNKSFLENNNYYVENNSYLPKLLIYKKKVE
ncbi:MAG: hypothetical protein PWQ43_736 [Rikenellaceae bacterium]|nr:hypothetical protein [Rikenellaceae bacterium]